MALVPGSEVEAGLRRRHAVNGGRAVARADDLRSVAGVRPGLCRRRCHRRDGESENKQLGGEPLPVLHLNSLSRVSCHVSTVRRAVVSVVRSGDGRSVKLLTQRSSGSSSRAFPKRNVTALLRLRRTESTAVLRHGLSRARWASGESTASDRKLAADSTAGLGRRTRPRSPPMPSLSSASARLAGTRGGCPRGRGKIHTSAGYPAVLAPKDPTRATVAAAVVVSFEEPRLTTPASVTTSKRQRFGVQIEGGRR